MTSALQDDRWWSRADSESGRIAESNLEGRNAFIALVFFTGVLLLGPQAWFPVLAHLRIALVAGGAALIFMLWDRWHHRQHLGVTREILPCFALAGWAILTLPLSYWPGGSTSVLLDSYLKAVLIFFLLANVITTARRLRFIAMTLVLCTLPLSITTLKNYATGNFIVENGSLPKRVLGYQSSLAGNPNDLALMLNLIIPLGIAIFVSKPKPVIAFLCFLVIAVDVLAVILTYSRAGFLGLATIGVVYFFKLLKRQQDRKWAVAVLMLVVVALPILPADYTHRIATIANVDADTTGSAQNRWQNNVAATHFVTQHPILGAGIGMSVLALNETGGRWHVVHNVYLEYAVDLGLPGLVLFLLLFYRVFRATRSSSKRAASVAKLRDLFLLDEGLEVSLIVFAVAGFFHPVAYHFYFYYIAGLALAARSATDTAIKTSNLIDYQQHENAFPRARGERGLAVKEFA